jgi:hypothetical protein
MTSGGWRSRLDQWFIQRLGPERVREIEEGQLSKHRGLFGERAFTVINGKSQVASRLSVEGRYQEALELYEQVLVQRAERYGPDHPKTRLTKLMMAQSLIGLGRSEEARDVLSGLVEACVRLQGGTDDETLRARIWLAKAFINLGDYGSAHEELKAIFQAHKQTGRWWDPEAETRTKEYWRMVSSEEIPD